MAQESYREIWRRRSASGTPVKMSQVASLLWVAARAVEEGDTEIAQLRTELDKYQGRPVYHCLDAGMAAAALSLLDEPDGTILRATDTGREMVLSGGAWQPRE